MDNKTYCAISSIWESSDSELLELMLTFYPNIEPHPILDTTHNRGRIWKGSHRIITTMDIDPRHKPMIVADNRFMDCIQSNSFGVIVYDPPHVGPQGRDKSVKRFDIDFGANVECGNKQGWCLSYLYPPFLEHAKRILMPKGLLFAKITDMINNHRSQWAHCDFMAMAKDAGFTVCDLIIKIRSNPMTSSKWKKAHHARKRHCYWVVCRNGISCE